MVSWAGLRRHRQPRLDLAQFTSLSNPSGLSSVSTASLWWGAARAPSRVTTWCELREQGWQRCAKVSTATGGPLLQSPSPFPPCAKPPPLHCINILGDKWLPQPICFFVQICSQFGNMIYKYCLCSQGLTLMYVRPDGWMPCWPQILPRRVAWGSGVVSGFPSWSQPLPRRAAEGVQGWCPGIPLYGVEEWQGPELSEHMALWPTTAARRNEPLLSSPLFLLGNLKLSQSQPLIFRIDLSTRWIM